MKSPTLASLGRGRKWEQVAKACIQAAQKVGARKK